MFSPRQASHCFFFFFHYEDATRLSFDARLMAAFALLQLTALFVSPRQLYAESRQFSSYFEFRFSADTAALSTMVCFLCHYATLPLSPKRFRLSLDSFSLIPPLPLR